MTVIKHKEQRVGIFIDTQNLYHSAKNLYKRKVNFGAILKEGVAGRKLVRAIAYVITTEREDEKGFFEALEKLGIETKTKDLQIFFGGAKKADWDVGVVIDMIRLSNKLDVMVLVSGDGDYLPAVEFLKNQGHLVEAMAFGPSASNKLVAGVDEFIDLDKNSQRYVLPTKPRHR